MTAPTVRASATTVIYGDAAPIVMPTHVAGDLILLAGGWPSTSYHGGETASSTWADMFPEAISTGSDEALGLFGRWTIAATNHETISIGEGTGAGHEFVGVAVSITAGTFNPTTPINAYNVAHGSSANPPLVGITPTSTADRLLVSGFHHNANSAPPSATVPAPWTKIAQASDDFAVAAMAYRTWLVGTTYDGLTDWTFSQGNDWRAFSVLINPVASGTVGPKGRMILANQGN